MKLKIRKYHPNDIKSLYNICLHTSNKGNDVELLKDDPNLIGELFITPYVQFEPELCFIIALNDEPCGYIIGTKNTEGFYLKCEKEYFPKLRKKYEHLPQDKNSRYAVLKRVIQIGHKPKDRFDLFPAHLHINILPIAKGKGMGRKLMDEFINKLRTLNVSGLHLEVGKSNKNAIQFYEHLGFREVKDYEYSLVMGIVL
ncbi:MAG: GNAT family N-acetyltransferase [Ignavibacteriae bacterium]|nr:GNAT family N-acetyltransferase [Ignavibacteriota bacterium]